MTTDWHPEYRIAVVPRQDHVSVQIEWKIIDPLLQKEHWLSDPGYPSDESINVYPRSLWPFSSMQDRIGAAKKKLEQKAIKRQKLAREMLEYKS